MNVDDRPHDEDDPDEAEPRLWKRDFVFILVFVVILTLLVFVAATHGSGDTITPQ
jgi:hypothetical protein